MRVDHQSKNGKTARSHDPAQRAGASGSAKHGFAAIYFRREFVALGGLMSYGPDQTERFRRAAAVIDKSSRAQNPPI
jgi:hypothetical protein